ncbi:MAG: hypothetical protein WC530_09980 [Candidatus Omnitrophota bacterium]
MPKDSKRDIVYILGSGSRWKNNELRYSMRSLENMDHGKVFVIGEKPIFLTDKVIHIPAKDVYDNKLKNSLEKQIIAAKDPRVSSRFILMNDDFFIMEPTSIIPVHLGRLESAIQTHETKGGYYYRALRLALDMLRVSGIKNPINYETHTPIVYEKKKFLDLAERLNVETSGYLIRSLYGNLFKIGGRKIKDVKVYTSWNEWNGGTFLSVDDTIPRKKIFQDFLKQRFPRPSVYENQKEDECRRVAEIEKDYTFIQATVWNGRQYNVGDLVRTSAPTVHMKLTD